MECIRTCISPTFTSGGPINITNDMGYDLVTFTDCPKIYVALSKAEINKNKRIEREKLNSKNRKNSRWC